MCFIAFNLKTTGPCKFFLYLQDPVITEPCNFIALGSGVVHRDVAQEAVGCFVPVPIGFLFSPAVIWLPIPEESKEDGTDRGRNKIK